MKSFLRSAGYVLIFVLVFPFIFTVSSCKKEKPVVYAMGIFPDTVYNLAGLNSEYDDYNINIRMLEGSIPVIFSSNRASRGGQFDLVQGVISFSFDQVSGNFILNSEITSDPYYSEILRVINTEGDDFGPYSYFSSNDGYEYLFVSSETQDNGLDMFFVKSLPRFGNNSSAVTGPFPVSTINSSLNDAYITFNFIGDSIYFCSDRDGDFDIYVQKRNTAVTTDIFLGGSFKEAAKADSINSSYNDKAPFIYMNYMVFASDRTGGMGGYDLYYSVYRNGKWGSPVNMGPKINSASNEYRPVILRHRDFTNVAVLFSSDRPGGKGNYDLYLAGFTFPQSHVIY